MPKELMKFIRCGNEVLPAKNRPILCPKADWGLRRAVLIDGAPEGCVFCWEICELCPRDCEFIRMYRPPVLQFQDYVLEEEAYYV